MLAIPGFSRWDSWIEMERAAHGWQMEDVAEPGWLGGCVRPLRLRIEAVRIRLMKGEKDEDEDDGGGLDETRDDRRVAGVGVGETRETGSRLAVKLGVYCLYTHKVVCAPPPRPQKHDNIQPTRFAVGGG